jgi:hypothetical protein
VLALFSIITMNAPLRASRFAPKLAIGHKPPARSKPALRSCLNHEYRAVQGGRFGYVDVHTKMEAFNGRLTGSGTSKIIECGLR